MKRIRWELEEMVAMVDLYYRDKNGEVDNLNYELSELSRKLNKRADILDIDHDHKFRNLNGMKMIFQNVRYADTDGFLMIPPKQISIIGDENILKQNAGWGSSAPGANMSGTPVYD